MLSLLLVVALTALPDPAPVDGWAQNVDAVVERYEREQVWNALADCESGEWTADGHVPGSARWDLPPADHTFEGGLQFHPRTWDAFKPEGYPEAAHHADRWQQIVVAERVLDAQGWRAWPVCSRRIGMRA